MKGRKRVPTAIKRLLGNPGCRPLNDDEPQLPPFASEPPEEMDAGARAEWVRVVSLLCAAGVLTEGDRGVLALYCVSWSRWRDAEKKVKKFGVMLKGVSGVLIPNPYLLISRQCGEQMLKCAAVLGLDPANRSRIRAAVASGATAGGAKVAVRPKTNLDRLGAT